MNEKKKVRSDPFTGPTLHGMWIAASQLGHAMSSTERDKETEYVHSKICSGDWKLKTKTDLLVVFAISRLHHPIPDSPIG
jgi:hypothetical protein